jgi:hypothetical protein
MMTINVSLGIRPAVMADNRSARSLTHLPWIPSHHHPDPGDSNKVATALSSWSWAPVIGHGVGIRAQPHIDRNQLLILGDAHYLIYMY